MTNELIKVLIIGLGNILMSDDGLGVVAVEHLRKTSKAHESVVMLDVGISSLNYLEEVGRTENIIAIDAITAGKPPGTIYRIDGFDIPSNIQMAASHGCFLPEVLSLSRELTGLPHKAIIYGIEPLDYSPGFNISPQVQTSLKRLIPIIGLEIEYILKFRKHLKDDIIA